MTRPKRIRQAEKRKKQAYDCRNLPLLRRSFAQLTPKYGLELALMHIGGTSYALQMFWHPHDPTEDELRDLSHAKRAEVLSIYAAAANHEKSTS